MCMSQACIPPKFPSQCHIPVNQRRLLLLSLPQARKQFQSQVAELEKLPEILKLTETKLAECQDQLKSYEKKNMDLSAMITDLRQRVREWQKPPTRTSSRGK